MTDRARIAALRPSLERLLVALPETDRLARAYEELAAVSGLWAAASAHGIDLLLADALERTGVRLPGEVRAAERRRAAVSRTMWIEQVLQETAASLDGAGIPNIVLKGQPLARRLYPSPELRPSNDIDVLVAPERLDEAIEAVGRAGYRWDDSARERGYRRHHHHLHLEGPAHPVLELHFALHVGFGRPMEGRGFFERSVRTRLGDGLEVPVLCPPDEFAYLALHAAGHLFERLLWTYDMRRHAETYGAETVVEGCRRAEALGAGIPARLALDEVARITPGARTRGPGAFGRVGRVLARYAERAPATSRRRTLAKALYGTAMAGPSLRAPRFLGGLVRRSRGMKERG